MFVFYLLLILSIFFGPLFPQANEPYDHNLEGKNLICFANSNSIEDWGIKFLPNKSVMLYSLDKFIFELYEHKRSYKSDERNIKIYNGKEIDILINRRTLRFANKKCSLTDHDPLFLLKDRIEYLKKSKTKRIFCDTCKS